MEQYSSLLLGMGGGGGTRVYGTIFITVVRRGGGREPMEQYSSLLLGMRVDESLWNNIHLCC